MNEVEFKIPHQQYQYKENKFPFNQSEKLVNNKNEEEKEEKLKNEYYRILDDRRNIIYN